MSALLGACGLLQRSRRTKLMGAPICRAVAVSMPVLWLSTSWLGGAAREGSGVTLHRCCSGNLPAAGDRHCNLGASYTLTESDTTGQRRNWKSCAMMSRFCLRQPRYELPSCRSRPQGAPSSCGPREEAPGGTAALPPMQPRRSTAWPAGMSSWWTAWRRCRTCGATSLRKTRQHPCTALPTIQMLPAASHCRW